MAGPGLRWLRAWLTPPVAEHLAFRMGNQVIFIFVEVDEWWRFDPTDNRVFLDVAREANAVPCLMPMRQRVSARPARYGRWRDDRRSARGSGGTDSACRCMCRPR